MYFVLYKDAALQWRWTLYAANNKKIANGGEGYYNKQDALHGISLVSQTGNLTPVYDRG